MDSPRTKLSKLPPGILQTVALQLHHTDYIQFAKTCGRFMRLILDKRFMHRLMYRSLYFGYRDYTRSCIINLTYHTVTYLPNGIRYLYVREWREMGNISMYEIRDLNIHAFRSVHCVDFRLEMIPAYIMYIVKNEGMSIRHCYDEDQHYIVLYLHKNGRSLIIWNNDKYRRFESHRDVVDAELIEIIINNGFDLCHPENYNFHKYFQKYIDYLHR